MSVTSPKYPPQKFMKLALFSLCTDVTLPDSTAIRSHIVSAAPQQSSSGNTNYPASMRVGSESPCPAELPSADLHRLIFSNSSQASMRVGSESPCPAELSSADLNRLFFQNRPRWRFFINNFYWQWLLTAGCHQRIRYCQPAVTSDFAADSQYNLWSISYGMCMHLWVSECCILFSGHSDIDL